MKKRAIKTILTVLLCTCLLGGTVACGDSTGNGARVKFLYTGTSLLLEQMNELINEYNNGQGEKDGITILPVPTTVSDYQAKVQTNLASRNGPDLVMTYDRYYKIYTNRYADLREFEGVDDLLDDLYSNLSYRMRFNRETLTSQDGDPLYGLPFYSNDAVTFYNKTILEAMGVTCISVPEDKIEEFNAGTYIDGNGKTKSDYVSLSGKTVYPRGYFRYDGQNFINDGMVTGDYSGENWSLPGSNGGDALCVFNDRIPMSYDEAEDVALLMTATRNPKAGNTMYGYMTEWWFSYGWSVGGDCIEDINNDGTWKYTLPDASTNYMVIDEAGYTGAYTGKTYTKGEILDWIDKMGVNTDERVVANNDGTFSIENQSGTLDIRAEVSADAESGKLQELPSIRETFSRFAMLSGQNGLKCCPTPNEVITTSTIQMFLSDKIAFATERLDFVQEVAASMDSRNVEWGITFCPKYKIYEDVNDGNSVVSAEGLTSTFSEGYGLAIRNTSQMKDQAYTVMKWLLTEGQKKLAENGYLTARIDQEETFLNAAKSKGTIPNPELALEMHTTALAGDWWYMTDRSWIENWSNVLNGPVRNGLLSIDDFLTDQTILQNTNKSLDQYHQ